MATQTTNLGLTLPDNGEKVSRQIINTNNTLIDNAFSGVGAKIYDVTLEVSNVSGAYSGTVYDDKITASMRAIDIYAVDPSIFNDKIHVTCYAGYLTITCDDVAGTTDVTISVLKSVNDPTALSSTEFDILSNRIGDLDDLTTTVKTNVVNAINEVNSGLSTANDHIANIEIFSNSANQTYGKWIDGSTVYRLAKQWTNVSISANTDVAFASITELYGKSVVDMNVTLKHSGGVISNNRNVETWLTDGTNVKVLNIRQGHASVGTWDVYAVFYYL